MSEISRKHYNFTLFFVQVGHAQFGKIINLISNHFDANNLKKDRPLLLVYFKYLFTLQGSFVDLDDDDDDDNDSRFDF